MKTELYYAPEDCLVLTSRGLERGYIFHEYRSVGTGLANRKELYFSTLGEASDWAKARKQRFLGYWNCRAMRAIDYAHSDSTSLWSLCLESAAVHSITYGHRNNHSWPVVLNTDGLDVVLG